MGLFSRQGTEKASKITWSVVELDSPLPGDVGMDNIKFGVVVSSDAMLEQTQTMLFCPLVSGLDDRNMRRELLPWHVEVTVEQAKHADKAKAAVTPVFPYSIVFLSTKIVLPISRNEINPHGRQYGRLNAESQRKAAATLKLWMPFALGDD